MRTYEFAFITHPQISEDDAAGLVGDVKQLLESGGARITKEESWGKRKLAYPINKVTEGRYVFLYLEVDPGDNPFPEVERRMVQNDKILRFLAVRTDEDLKRAARKGKQKPAAADRVARDDRDDEEE